MTLSPRVYLAWLPWRRRPVRLLDRAELVWPRPWYLREHSGKPRAPLPWGTRVTELWKRLLLSANELKPGTRHPARWVAREAWRSAKTRWAWGHLGR